MNFLVEGLDRLGKDSLVEGMLDTLGFHQVIHRSKPKVLSFYEKKTDNKSNALAAYQWECFNQDMNLLGLADLAKAKIIFNRAWLGEAVYANLYRGYDGNYVFDLEIQNKVVDIKNLRLILLTEDFLTSKHFVDDGLSIDVNKREREQEMFVEAFNKSAVQDKRIICVTDPITGNFRPKEDILRDAIS